MCFFGSSYAKRKRTVPFWGDGGGTVVEAPRRPRVERGDDGLVDSGLRILCLCPIIWWWWWTEPFLIFTSSLLSWCLRVAFELYVILLFLRLWCFVRLFLLLLILPLCVGWNVMLAYVALWWTLSSEGLVHVLLNALVSVCFWMLVLARWCFFTEGFDAWWTGFCCKASGRYDWF